MSHQSHGSGRGDAGLISFLFENSLFLVAGAAAAFVWANLHYDSYRAFKEFDLRRIWVADADLQPHDEPRHDAKKKESSHSGNGNAAEHPPGESGETGEHDGHSESGGHHGLTIHFIVNDVLMALFFAIAAGEVVEALLPGGPLANFRKAATPLLATLGGIVGPALFYLAGVALFGHLGELGRGWAIPTATDIAFSYLVARLVFGPGHPAIAFLLLLAIADDAAGLAILAVFYPKGDVAWFWLLLAVAAVGCTFLLRRLRVNNFWWYLLIPGVMCWLSFHWAHLHPALGLVPIIFAMPHAHTDLGLFAREELKRTDSLSAFQAWWKHPVELVLGLFGLTNAGVAVFGVEGGYAVLTWSVLLALIVGKPVGIAFFTWLGERAFKLEIPAGMRMKHIVVLGVIAGIGFTVALFVSDAAFSEPGPIQDAAKLGALLSLSAAGLAILMARLSGIKPLRPDDEGRPTQPATPPDDEDDDEPRGDEPRDW